MGDLKVCKCGNKNCFGFILLHQKELKEIETIKNFQRERHGEVIFNLESSPSSGEIFTKFYELHVIDNN